jgi:small-conductance mechanosensitive channel
MQILDYTFLGNPVRGWLVAAAIALLIAGGLSLFKVFLLRRAEKLAARTQTDLDDIFVATLASTKFTFLVFLGIWAGARTLTLPSSVVFPLRLLTIIVSVVQVAAWVNVALRAFVQRRIQQNIEEDPGAATTFAAIGFGLRLLVWFILILVALSNLGIQIGPLLAGLGVGGVAVALALQNILGDLFASLSIVLDKPFVIGDFIIVGESQGTVEYIGLKTTRLRSLTGEQVIISNSDLLRSRIRNMKRMHERRVQFEVSVAYRTPPALIERIPGMIQQAIEAQTSLRFERSHLRDFAGYACNFESVYWVKTADYTVFVNAQQAIHLELRHRFDAQNIDLARPVQSVFRENLRG